MNPLQSIIASSQRASVQSAETQRLAALSNIENAICDGSYTVEETKRLQRLAGALIIAHSESAQRKFDIINDTVIPTLISMGLVQEI